MPSDLTNKKNSLISVWAFLLAGILIMIFFVLTAMVAPQYVAIYVLGMPFLLFVSIMARSTLQSKKKFDTYHKSYAKLSNAEIDLYFTSLKTNWKKYIPQFLYLGIFFAIGIFFLLSGVQYFYFIFMLGMSALAFYQGFREYGYIRTIENVPTSTIRSVAMGLTEVRGKAFPLNYYSPNYVPPSEGKIWLSPLYYHREMVFRYQNTPTEETLSLLNAAAKNISSYTSEGPMFVSGPGKELIRNPNHFNLDECFWVEDSTGKILVDAYGANINTNESFASIPVGTTIYVFGKAAPLHSDHPALKESSMVIHKEGFYDPHYISLNGERRFLTDQRTRARFLIGFGSIMLVFMAVLIVLTVNTFPIEMLLP